MQNGGIAQRRAGRTSLVSSLSGIVSKQAYGIWSREPGAGRLDWSDLTQAVAAKVQTRLVAASQVVEFYGAAVRLFADSTFRMSR